MRYEARAYVHTEGVHKKTIPASAVRKLIEKLRNEGFFQWEEKDMVCVEFPIDIMADLNGQHKHVLEGCNSPGQVLSLADEIDRISVCWEGTLGSTSLTPRQGF